MNKLARKPKATKKVAAPALVKPDPMALLFDTETTGLIDNRTVKLEKQPEIIEYYGCIASLRSGEIVDELDVLIRPSRPEVVTKEITRITGLTWDEHLHDKEPFAKQADKIFSQIQGAPIVIAHNLSFDKEMIDIESQRLNTKVKWPKRLLCTVEQTIHLKGFRLNLSNLHELLFGERFDGAHRAKVDVQALVRCAVELHKRELI